MAGPQPAIPHLLLQGSNKLDEVRGMDVPLAAQKPVERLDFLSGSFRLTEMAAHELLRRSAFKRQNGRSPKPARKRFLT